MIQGTMKKINSPTGQGVGRRGLSAARAWVVAAILGLFATPRANAVISEPHNLIWGSVLVGGKPATAADSQIVVEARRGLNSPPLASYRMGENRKAGDLYSLALPLESVNPIHGLENAKVGETLLILVHNGEFVRYLTLYTVGERGAMLRLDLGDVDNDTNGLIDNWERQFFGADGQNPDGDPDRDRVVNRNEMLGGTNPLLPDARHPADVSPTNNIISIHEVTAYALAWKTGQPWATGPADIPVDFVARAGYLWKNGERYLMNTNALDAGPPVWWTNVVDEAALSLASKDAVPETGAASGNKTSVRKSELPNAVELPVVGRLVRTLAAVDGNGSEKNASIEIQPGADISAYGLEETIPVGWTVAGISDQGIFDPADRKIRWGLFLDDRLRSVNYRLRATGGGTASARLEGLGAFDGNTVEVSGAALLMPPDSIQWMLPGLRVSGRLVLKLKGEPGRDYQIEDSVNLSQWSAFGTVTADADGTVEFEQDLGDQEEHRFFRARQVDPDPNAGSTR
jgi:hypothetical protein